MKRIALLDGMRGVAALYVVLHHAYEEVREVSPNDWLVGPLASGSGSGITRSPCSSSCRGSASRLGTPVRGGFSMGVRPPPRPPHPASLLRCPWAVALPDLGSSRRLAARMTPAGAACGPAFEAKTLAAHGLLVHNLRYAWCYRIDPPMWSVATEWQILGLLPAILWLSRRWGMGAGSHRVCPRASPVPFVHHSITSHVCPWYAGLFALGIAAADGRRLPHSPRWLVPLALPLCLFLADSLAVSDAFVGAVTVAYLAYVASGMAPDWLVKPVESRPAVALGAFSYSLYLTHYPVQAWATAALVELGFSPAVRLLLLLGPVTLLCLAVAYGFHLVAERPFMPGHVRSLGRAEVAAAVSPAP